MKLQIFIAVLAVAAFAACKSPYKATDRPRSTTDTTATATDTSATINNAPVSTDTTAISKADTARMDTISRQTPDTTSRMDTTNRQFPDSTRKDTSTMQPDTTSTSRSVEKSSKSSVAPPPAVEAVFIKQYPTASNVEWTAYDSLAAVPIDMRLTGWEGLDAEDYMARFDYKDETYYAWFDGDGKWIGSAYAMKDISKLPAAVNTAVKNAIKSRYSGYEISKVNREFQTGKNAYEVELIKDESKVRMLVTPSGKITEIFKYTAEKK